MTAARHLRLVDSTELTLAQAQRIVREAMRDKSYLEMSLGQDIAAYLRAKRKRLTDASYRDYEGSLDKLARYYLDLELGDFEPPMGTRRVEEFLDAQWGAGAPRTYNKNLSILKDFFRRDFAPPKQKPLRRVPRPAGNVGGVVERARTAGLPRPGHPADHGHRRGAQLFSLRR